MYGDDLTWDKFGHDIPMISADCADPTQIMKQAAKTILIVLASILCQVLEYVRLVCTVQLVDGDWWWRCLWGSLVPLVHMYHTYRQDKTTNRCWCCWQSKQINILLNTISPRFAESHSPLWIIITTTTTTAFGNKTLYVQIW